MTAITLAAPRRTPWYGIGVSGEWASSAEALEAARLDFVVRQERLHWNREIDDGMFIEEPAPMFGNVRNTDDKLLGCVTPQYRIIQNSKAFSLIDPFLKHGKIVHAGMTEDGLCFMIAELFVQMIGGENYQINLMVTNSFNARYPCQLIMTPVRIVCQNMYRGLVKDRIFLAKHTTAANDRLRRIASSGVIEKTVYAFSDVVTGSQSKALGPKELQLLVGLLFPYPKKGSEREAAFKARADEQRKKFMEVYYDAPDNLRHHGTGFGFVNAYFDYLSHREPARRTSTTWEDRRLQGLVNGVDINRSVIKAAIG